MPQDMSVSLAYPGRRFLPNSWAYSAVFVDGTPCVLKMIGCSILSGSVDERLLSVSGLYLVIFRVYAARSWQVSAALFWGCMEA